MTMDKIIKLFVVYIFTQLASIFYLSYRYISNRHFEFSDIVIYQISAGLLFAGYIFISAEYLSRFDH